MNVVASRQADAEEDASQETILTLARRVLSIEITGLQALSDELDQGFATRHRSHRSDGQQPGAARDA